MLSQLIVNYANIMGTALKKFFYTKSNIAWSLNGNIISINLYDEIVKLQACFFVKCLCKMCQNACAYYTQWNDDGVVSIVKWDMILRTCLFLSCNMFSVINCDASNMFLNVILPSMDDEITKIWLMRIISYNLFLQCYEKIISLIDYWSLKLLCVNQTFTAKKQKRAKMFVAFCNVSWIINNWWKWIALWNLHNVHQDVALVGEWHCKFFKVKRTQSF